MLNPNSPNYLLVKVGQWPGWVIRVNGVITDEGCARGEDDTVYRLWIIRIMRNIVITRVGIKKMVIMRITRVSVRIIWIIHSIVRVR